MSRVILLLVLWMSFAMTCDAANMPDCLTTLAKASEVYCDIPSDNRGDKHDTNPNPNSVFGAYKQACKLKIDPWRHPSMVKLRAPSDAAATRSTIRP